jgi:hypothetical protein
VILDMSTRARRLSGLTAAAMAVAMLPGSVLAAGNVRVNQTNLGINWFFDADTSNGTGEFRSGPATPPSGAGSFGMTTLTASDKSTLLTSDWLGHPLSELSAMDYWTYRDGSSTSPPYIAPSINIAVLTNDPTPGAEPFATLVFEPLYAYGNDAIHDDEWQQWDTQQVTPAGTGGWWVTRQVGSICATACYTTLADIQEQAPNATIIALGVNVGRGPASFVGAVDALSLTMAGETTTYDFEFLDETKGNCKNDGWKEFHNPMFKNQGDCVSFFASANRHGPKVHDLAAPTSTVTKHGNGHTKSDAKSAKATTAKVHKVKHAASTKKVTKQADTKGKDKPKNK